MLRTLPFVALLGFAACAPTPESIQPDYVSDVPYQSWSCPQLSGEQGRLNYALAAASSQQQVARQNDTAGVIILKMPVGSLSGQAVTPQIARYKGEQRAVNNAMISNNCGAMQSG